jgi:predicted flap endonuclease-1-like 5' DNA nuclease
MDFIETNWLLILIVAALAILIAWYIFHAARRTRVTGATRDVLDEGAAPAARNQALIDAPRSVGEPAGVPGPAQAVPAVTELPPVPAPGSGDDLTRLKGVGPKLAAHLGAIGVTSFAQIARWSDAEIDRIDAQLGRFQGRIRRDDWVAQAGLLAAGDEGAYAARFGNIS